MKDHLLGCCPGVGESQGLVQSPEQVTEELLLPPGLSKQGEETVSKTHKESVKKTHLWLCLAVWSPSEGPIAY